MSEMLLWKKNNIFDIVKSQVTHQFREKKALSGLLKSLCKYVKNSLMTP